jgi:hypothetical protein
MRRTFVLALAFAACATSSASAAPAGIDMRVEGSARTFSERALTTDAKRVTQHGTSYPCDGTNAKANPTPGPTMTAALDDAAALDEYTWEGTWFASLEDFFIDRIGTDRNSGPANWGLVLNWHSTERGGCQTRVASGDEVLFAYDLFSKLHLLKLIAPRFAKTGEAFQVKVVDGADQEPIAGASVEGVLTGADGLATLRYDSAGLRRPKATRVDSLRSNAGSICVYESGTPPCPDTSPPPPAGPGNPPGGGAGEPSPASATGPLERDPPIARISYPRAGARYRKGPRGIRGSVREEGSGIDRIELVLLRRRGTRCSWWSAALSRFAGASCRRPSAFRASRSPRWSYRLPRRLDPARYEARVRAFDRAGNMSARHRVRFRVRTR